MSTAEMVPVAAEARGVSLIHGGAGTLAMALMPEDEFAQRLAALKKGQERIRTIKRELMVEDAHYGTIPGTDKPTLLKPGAEVLCSIYGLRADFHPSVEYGDGDTQPAVRVTMRCELHLGDLMGPVVAVGYGAANSWERKHRYRKGERTCPDCGVVGSVRRSSYPNKMGDYRGEKGWWCRDCRTNWDNPKEPAILEQQTGMETNPDQHDLENTLVKMAKKRAHIDAALTGTASSDLFTQDLDEQDHHEAAPATKAAGPPRGAPADAAEGTSSTRTVGADDDPGWPNDPTAHERHGVEPARPAKAPPKKAAPSGEMPECPRCKGNGRVSPSRYPKPWGTHFCRACSEAFEPGVSL